MKERFTVLDIFRGIFSSLVVFYHMSAFSATPVINNHFVQHSDMFVDFFFVLSGFVITYSYQFIKTGSELGTFYKKRFFRLYPLHLIVLLIFLVIELLKLPASGYVHVNRVTHDGNNLTTFITNLFLVNSVKMPGVHDVTWNIASWSISAEMIAYFVFGITMVGINSYKLSRIKNIIYFFIIAIVFSALYFLTNSFYLIYTFDYGFLRGLAGFFIGVVCFNTYNYSKEYFKQYKNTIFTFLEIASLAITFTFIWYGDIFKPYGFIYEALFFATILIFAFEKGWLSALLKRSKFLHNMGKYSYSIYMIHTLILSLFNIVFIRVFKLPPSSYAYLFIVNYLIVYAISSWTFKNIEMRFNLSNKQPGKKGWWLW